MIPLAKERPILFNGEMVRSLLREDNPKTNTRRIMKVQPSKPNMDLSLLVSSTNRDERKNKWKYHWVEMSDDNLRVLNDDKNYFSCPYGQVGDEFWVRETWAPVNSESGPGIAYRADHTFMQPDFDGPDEGAGPSYNYEKYPGEYSMWITDLFNGCEGHSWKPSIFMPRWASRLQLKITNVRFERLEDISEEDAISEGIETFMHHGERAYKDYMGRAHCLFCPKLSFFSLWEKINGRASLNSNPFVWAIQFEKIGGKQ